MMNKKHKFHLYCSFAVALLVFSNLSLAGNKKVLLVGIDGMQHGHIAKLNTPALDRLTITKAYAGGVKGKITEQSTSSGPGWASLLTGVWVNKHGISNNHEGPTNNDWPSIFRYIYNANNQAEIYSFATWGTINSQIFSQDLTLLTAHSEGGGDEHSLNLALNVLRTNQPDFIFIHLDEPDGAGHTYGWGNQYDNSITDSDARLGQLLNEVERREEQLGEDWLVLVTTDHGRDAHTGNPHGNQKISEKTVFIASNKTLNQEYKKISSVANQHFSGLYNYPSQTYIVPTILQFLGFSQNDYAHLDGFPLLGTIEVKRIYTNINGNRCGLEWDSDIGTPSTLLTTEHVAKFDCFGNADPMLVIDNKIYSNIYGSSCGFQWDAAKGSPSTLGSNEHVAKFDCSDKADVINITNSYIYSTIQSSSCGLEWDADNGTPSTLLSHEHVAKFDCDGNADPVSVE